MRYRIGGEAMLVPMSKVYVIGLKEHFFDALDGLHDFGKVHLTDLSPDIDSGRLPIDHMVLIESTEHQHEEMRELKQRGDALVASLFGSSKTPCSWALRDGEVPTSIKDLIAEALAYLDDIEPKAQKLLEDVARLGYEQAELLQYEPLLTKVEPILDGLVAGRPVFSMALLIENRFADSIPELRKVLEEATDGNSKVHSVQLDEDMSTAIIIADEEHTQTVREILTDEQFTAVKLPHAFNEIPFGEALAQMRARIDELPELLEHARHDVAVFAEQNRAEICTTRNELTNRIAQIDAIQQFGETRYSFVMVGYIPKDEVDELKRFFSERWSNKISVEEQEIDVSEYSQVPVKIENPPKLKGFQAVMGIWGTPSYGTFDASKIIALSFPFLFGMIVGDVGYGFTLFALSMLFSKLYPKNAGVQAFTQVLKPAGLMTMLFGVFYWEMFGDLAHVYIPGLNQVTPVEITPGFAIPFIRTSSEMQTAFLLMALAAGVIQVLIGLFLGIKSNKGLGQTKHVYEKSGIILIIVSALFLAAVQLIPVLTASLPPIAASAITYLIYLALAVGFIMTIYGGGIMGAIETVESAAHIASYIRIMAVGLVGGLLADAANKLAFVTMPNIGGWIIALVLHVLNFAIIVFSPSIHALRLTFLEFFGKFWTSTKVVYNPFARVGKGGSHE